MARDLRIDTIKGILIILVVMGHIITTFDNHNVINHGVMGLIYIFHMPLFILLSGYFSKTRDTQRASDFWRGTLGLLVTLVIFHLISSSNVLLHGGNTLRAIKRFPFGILWYLMGLVYWRIALYYTPSALLKRPYLYLGLALAVTILCGLSKLGNLLALQRGMNFYFFFLLGYYYRQGQLSTRWWQANKVHALVAIVLLPLIFWLYPRCGNFMNGADHYTLHDLPQKGLIVICSIAVSLLVFNLTRANKYLAAIGQDSLFYYLIHMYIISWVTKPVQHYLDWPRSFPFILLYTAFTLLVVFLLSKVKPIRWLTRPIPPKKQKARP